MKFFVDTADVAEIVRLASMGLVDGVTTNPSLIAKSGREIKEVIADICAAVPTLPVSAEVTATDMPTMLEQADRLADIAENVVIKLPLTPDGIAACSRLSAQGIQTNVTLCFSLNQALLAAKAGATYISPFVGRHEDISQDGMELIEHICTVYDNYGYDTQVLVASVRGPRHIAEAAVIGADVCTIPPNVIDQLFEHPLTAKGLEQFTKDAKASKQEIL